MSGHVARVSIQTEDFDLGAEIAEQHAAQRTRDDVREVEHAQPGQTGSQHLFLPLVLEAGGMPASTVSGWFQRGSRIEIGCPAGKRHLLPRL